MQVSLEKVIFADAEQYWQMQCSAFAYYEEKYGPAVYSSFGFPLRSVRSNLQYADNGYYFIVVGSVRVGGLRIIEPGLHVTRRQIAPIFVLPEWQGKGIAREVFTQLYNIYGEDNWELETIVEESRNIRFYTSAGFYVVSTTLHRSGKCTVAKMQKGTGLTRLSLACLKSRAG